MADLEQKPGEELANDVESAAATSHTGIAGRIRNWFLTGLVVAGPLAVTAWLIWSVVNWVDDVVRPFIPPVYRPETYLPWPIPGTGLVVAFFALTLLGFLTANLVGRTLVGWGEGLLSHMPIRKVALVEFPAPGMWSLVFVSQPPGGDVAGKLPQGEHVSVFLPCTPNPTTGFFFFVKRDEMIELDITVENAMTLLISAGMVQSDDAQKKLAALASTARAAQVARRTESVE
jgi:uncharacterized membrane protein